MDALEKELISSSKAWWSYQSLSLESKREVGFQL